MLVSIREVGRGRVVTHPDRSKIPRFVLASPRRAPTLSLAAAKLDRARTPHSRREGIFVLTEKPVKPRADEPSAHPRSTASRESTQGAQSTLTVTALLHGRRPRQVSTSPNSALQPPWFRSPSRPYQLHRPPPRSPKPPPPSNRRPSTSLPNWETPVFIPM